MIRASEIINEIEINYPTPVSQKTIKELLLKLRDEIECSCTLKMTRSGPALKLIIKGDKREAQRFIKMMKHPSLLQEHGWFIRDEFIRSEQFPAWFMLEPMTFKRSVQVPRYLFHWTELHYLDDILDQGLIPMVSVGMSWHPLTYPPRIFFTLEPRKCSQVVNLRIDTLKLRGVSFYKDVSHTLAVWTDSPIPPEAIEVMNY